MSRPARQAIVAIYRATFPAAPNWPEGPLPLTHGDLRADTNARSTYYPPRTARVLYGSAGRPRRWHKTLNVSAGSVTVHGIEAIRLEDVPGASGLVMIHLHAGPSNALDVIRALRGRETARVFRQQGFANLNGYDPQHLLTGNAELPSEAPFTITLVTSRGRRLPRLYTHPRYLTWPATGQWLWALASRTNNSDHPPDPVEISLCDTDRIRLSADWSGLLLRDGMALVGTRPDQGLGDPFFNHAALYARSLYLDAIVLGLLQLQGITELENALATALDDSPTSAMADLEHQITLFRHQLWWQHLSTHGVPNQIISAFHRQHRLPERFEQILAEINDYNRLTRDDESRHMNNSIVLFTLITVPVGIALALLQVLGPPDPWIFSTVLAIASALTVLLLLTRPGRLAIRSIRRRLTP